MIKKWMMKRNKVDTRRMAQALKVAEPIAWILANRGIGTYGKAMEFLYGDIQSFESWTHIKNMKLGVSLLSKAIAEGKRIAVYGDYDVDGVMSTVQLYKAISGCGGQVCYYVPHRQREGYGLNIAAVEELVKDGIEVLVTCDNGIASLQEIARAKELSMTVIVLDHHEPLLDLVTGQEILPPADAVIDLKQQGETYGFIQYCAAGLAYRFCKALFETCGKPFILEEECLVLAAIATICDIVDLLGENRTLAKRGLQLIHTCKNPGMQELLAQTGLLDKTITEYHAGFIIGPCINATGRLSSAKMSVELFLEADRTKAKAIAQQLIELNQERKTMTEAAVKEVLESVENSGLKNDTVIVAYAPTIHESIAGIVAGRIKETYFKPVIVLTEGKEGAKGSARSIEGYHIFQEMLKCQSLFTRFGGHAMAAGLSLPIENIERLRMQLNQNCVLTEAEMQPIIRIEGQMSMNQVTVSLAKAIEEMGPFGKANPTPVFGCKNVLIRHAEVIGKDKNILRFSILDEETRRILGGIYFDSPLHLYALIMDKLPTLTEEVFLSKGVTDIRLDLVFSVALNRYNGRETAQLMIKDFRMN